MTIKPLYPSSDPTLDLNFAGARALDPRVTFTRSSVATRVGPDGLLQTVAPNVARFDHSPTTRESLGLLVEEQRTNLMLRSEEFDSASWAKSSITVSANVVTSPTGNVDADSIIDTSASTEHFYEQSCLTTTNQAYTQVIFAKAGTAPSFRMTVVAIGSSFTTSKVTFTQTAGVFVAGSAAGLITSATAVAVGNGWYRCAITYTLNGTVTTHAMRIYPYLAGIYVGTGLGTYFWGAQLEAGAFPTSYIPTTTATATRSADVASIGGSAFTSFYNQTEGTFYSENRIGGFQVNKYPNVFNVNDSTNNNVINNYRLDYAIRYTYGVFAGGVAQTSFSQSATIAAGAVAKMATAVATDNGILVVNGTEQGADTSLTMPTGINRLQIPGGGDMTIRRLTYWPRRLPNAMLQAITS
jgi:hypothetical protein